jgi:hypothetical protein
MVFLRVAVFPFAAKTPGVGRRVAGATHPRGYRPTSRQEGMTLHDHAAGRPRSSRQHALVTVERKGMQVHVLGGPEKKPRARRKSEAESPRREGMLPD